ncbi:unnamed protein product [Pedinophyceae sp. YPF-701]|nr:unnamed protein product [Pedinophyceae sp. YPF-701]
MTAGDGGAHGACGDLGALKPVVRSVFEGRDEGASLSRKKLAKQVGKKARDAGIAPAVEDRDKFTKELRRILADASALKKLGLRDAGDDAVALRKKGDKKRAREEKAADGGAEEKQKRSKRQKREKVKVVKDADEYVLPKVDPTKIYSMTEDEIESAVRTAIHAVDARFKGLGSRRSSGENLWKVQDQRDDFKTGPYSQQEKDILRLAVKTFAQVRGLSATDPAPWLTRSQKYPEARCCHHVFHEVLPHRRLRSLREAAIRMFHPDNNAGAWSVEDDRRLLQLVREHGRRWNMIGGLLGRFHASCKDRFKELKPVADTPIDEALEDEDPKQGMNKERFSEEEIEALRRILRELVGEDVDVPKVSWSAVSDAMVREGHLRNARQCQRFYDYHLEQSLKAAGKWGAGQDDALLDFLVRGVTKKGWLFEYQVPWDKAVRGRSAEVCKRRWLGMKRAIKGGVSMELGEVVRTLEQLREHKRRKKERAEGGGKSGEQEGAGSDVEE